MNDSRELLLRANRHDDDAARELLQRLYPTVVKIVRAMQYEKSWEEDLVQEIFLKVFSRGGQYRGGAPRTINWLQKELNLTPPQVEAIQPKVDKAMAELKAVQENGRTQSGRIAYRMFDEIVPDLSPAQQEQFKELRKKRTEAWLKQDLGK